jgi:hypothetical protein
LRASCACRILRPSRRHRAYPRAATHSTWRAPTFGCCSTRPACCVAVRSRTHTALPTWHDIVPNLPHTNNLYFIMYFLLSFLYVIHLRLLNYHLIHLLSLLMMFYFQCYKAILVYFYFVIELSQVCVIRAWLLVLF